jgi:phospholipase/carboxylesterase
MTGAGSAQILSSLGFRVDFHRYAMPHSVCAEEIRDLGDWLSQRFTHAG